MLSGILLLEGNSQRTLSGPHKRQAFLALQLPAILCDFFLLTSALVGYEAFAVQ